MGNLNERWARNIANNNPHEAGGFINQISRSYLFADEDNQIILDEAIRSLRHKYPEWDVPERHD